MRLSRILTAAATLLVSGSLLAANVTATSITTKEYPLNIGGTFYLENVYGNVEIIGDNSPRVLVMATQVATATDAAALNEARQQTQITVSGDANSRSVRTVFPVIRPSNWSSAVNYVVRVPRTVHVKINSGSAERVTVTNIIGNVTVKAFRGLVRLENVGGASIVENINGNVIFDPNGQPEANAHLTTINGSVIVAVDADANFEWIAESISGDIRTTLPVRGSFVTRTSFRGGVNAPGGPTVTATSMMGKVFLLKRGTQLKEAQPVRASTAESPRSPAPLNAQLPNYVFDQVQGPFVYQASLGNIRVREARGGIRLMTGAGEVQVGPVYGNCFVMSNGGPLRIGDVLGSVNARTEAGDVIVSAAREGGTITTGGGIIRLLYTGGPTTLISGGGDIVVRQANGPINAETKSGDINITVLSTLRSQRVTAKTSKGNIVLNVSPKFAADVDATVLTSDANANVILSELPGLEIRKETVGNKVRIRATGKINGGGEKIELFAEDGGIQLTTRAGAPIAVITPQ
jgi:hypothetical protein